MRQPVLEPGSLFRNQVGMLSDSGTGQGSLSKIFMFLIFRYQQVIEKYLNTKNFSIYSSALNIDIYIGDLLVECIALHIHNIYSFNSANQQREHIPCCIMIDNTMPKGCG